MKLPTLYSRRSDGKVQIWEKEVHQNKHRTHSGIKDGEIVVAKWTETIAKNVGKTNFITAENQAMTEAKAEWKKKKDKGYKEDINKIDNMTFFEPMLSKVWQDYKDKIIYPVYIQPKLDGMRLIANKSGLWTRNGKEYNSIPHIYTALKPLFDFNSDYIFDGEVYADKFANDFDKICSLARKTKPTQDDLIESAKNIEYHIYDFPYWDDIFSERFTQLNKVLKHCNCRKIKIVKTHKVNSDREVYSYFDKFVEDGYEGLMVRIDAKYENKRTKSLLKYKESKEAEYEILDVLEGVGNRSGGAGAIVCKNTNGSTFHSNIKGNRDFCKSLLLNKKDYVGKLATIQYFNLTPDNVPRFPYFLRIREEE